MYDFVGKLQQWFYAKRRQDSFGAYSLIFAFGLVALISSFILTVDQFFLLKHPNEVLNCSLNLVLNCATVMNTWQAEVFGFPNMLIGLMAYSALVAIAFVALTGVRFSKKFLMAFNLGIFLGLIFSEWLIYESIYSIGVLCPFCLAVAASTIVIFMASTHLALRNNVYKLNSRHNSKVQNCLNKGYDKMITLAWIALIALLIIQHFGSSLFA